uniref:SKI-interacting protein SKIP SNW domain-containing protein n=1 Tax=Strigamia maritima TaxID=126957 RepID=T1JH05_STRMM
MASLRSLLPAPTQPTFDKRDDINTEQRSKKQTAIVSSRRTIPPYGSRKDWIPRITEDYSDGGAFPEIQTVQFPLGMGKKDSTTSNAVAVQLDAQGKIKYDVLARQGHSKDRVVFSKFTDLLPIEVTEDDSDLQKPNEDDVEELTEKTRLALEKITNNKIAAAMPVRAADKALPAQYIRYTPSQQGVAFNSGAKQRVIRMVEIQRDPMEPPKFKINKKIPRGPPSPPAPVMHSPTRKVTVKEQQEWKIPPCISNWKNAKGMDSGFGDEDNYNVYDKPWRSGQAVHQSLYRPSKNIDKDTYGDDMEKLAKTNRFVPDKEFSGTDRNARREGPVQFERQEEEDPFGLDKFLTEAKKASKRPSDQTDKSRSSRDYDRSDKKRRRD